MESKWIKGHMAALLTILIWGTTFISTKVLLQDFQPIEILFFRFVSGFLILLIVCPQRLKIKEKKQERTFMFAGLCGVCLYYLLENIALTYTMASNVGVIISAAPFFTAILTHISVKEEKLSVRFFAVFFAAMTGIFLISVSGNNQFRINPFGDLLALIAAAVWACYSVLTRRISSYGYHTIQATKRVFAYGIVFMIPALFFFDVQWDIYRFRNPVYLANMVYLGAGASALCFVTWNFAVKQLGAVKTSIYIYMVPVITIITSVVVLHERITQLGVIGTILTLFGLFISEYRAGTKKQKNKKTDNKVR